MFSSIVFVGVVVLAGASEAAWGFSSLLAAVSMVSKEVSYAVDLRGHNQELTRKMVAERKGVLNRAKRASIERDSRVT